MPRMRTQSLYLTLLLGALVLARAAPCAAQSVIVTLAGGKSSFRETASDLRLGQDARIDPNGNALSARLGLRLRERATVPIELELGYARFGKAYIEGRIIDGVRTMATHYVGVASCLPIRDSAFSICGGLGYGETLRVIEDRLAREPDIIREGIGRVGIAYRMGENWLRQGTRWHVVAEGIATQNSRVSSFNIGLRVEM
jgi:hypothetical protein